MTFERARYNNAGYPVYKRKKSVNDISSSDNQMTRRGFLKILGGAAATAAVGTSVVYKNNESQDVRSDESTVSEKKDEALEQVESFPSSEIFEAQKEGFKQWWTLSFNEVQFLNADGSPVGEPVVLEDVIIEDPVRPGQMQRISVGQKNEFGLLVGGIAGAWLAYHRDMLGLDPAQGEGKIMHNTIEFEEILKETDEPELIKSIKDAAAGGNGVDTMVDIVRYFGMNPDKKVRGDTKERTRAAYLQEAITFHNKVPQEVQNELRRLVVGLAAQESRFNAGLAKNSATAEGIMQLVDAVRKEHGYDPDQKLSFMQEVDVAGKHFSNIYTRVRYWMKNEIVKNEAGDKQTVRRPETYQTLRALFPEGREGDALWQKYFLVPCIINAYNTGSRTIGVCLHEFVASHSKEELQQIAGENPGYDLFTKFTYFARESDTSDSSKNYGKDGATYFVSIAAAAEVL